VERDDVGLDRRGDPLHVGAQRLLREHGLVERRPGLGARGVRRLVGRQLGHGLRQGQHGAVDVEGGVGEQRRQLVDQRVLRRDDRGGVAVQVQQRIGHD
jgi:hypothetical protein